MVALAEKLLAAVDKGEGWAVKELGDRIDGRAAQTVDVSGDLNHNITKILLGDLDDDSNS